MKLERLLMSLGTEQVRIAAITVSELLHGSHRARSAAVRARRAAFADAVIDLVPALPFGPAEARRHAELWAQLGGPDYLYRTLWPQSDPSLAANEEITVVVQINGKVREKLTLAAGL